MWKINEVSYVDQQMNPDQTFAALLEILPTRLPMVCWSALGWEKIAENAAKRSGHLRVVTFLETGNNHWISTQNCWVHPKYGITEYLLLEMGNTCVILAYSIYHCIPMSLTIVWCMPSDWPYLEWCLLMLGGLMKIPAPVRAGKNSFFWISSPASRNLCC